MAFKKSTKEFAKEIIDLTGGEYRLESSYNGATNPVKIKHLACGNTFNMKPNSFLCGQRCSNPDCKRERMEHTSWEKSYAKLLAYLKNYPEYLILTSFRQYRGIDSYVRLYHTVCGSYYNVTPHAFESGKRCPQCANISRMIKHQKKNTLCILQSKLGKDYVIKTDKYENQSQSILVKHLACNHSYNRKASTILLGYGKCPYCSEKRGIYLSSLLKILDKHHCKLISENKKIYHSKDTIEVVHLDCGNHLHIRIGRIKSPRSKTGNICKYCNRKYVSESRMKPNDDFIKRFNKRLDSNEYVILTKYNGAHHKVKVKHLSCGNTFYMEANSLLKGQSCPNCSHYSKSVGENLVSKYLDQYDIDYEYQKTFPDLKDVSYLSYDFYIPDQNILIEYQGKQHYYPLSYFGGNKSFSKQVKHDQMKRDYAKEHGYTLVEIPYRNSYSDKMGEIKERLSFIVRT